MVGELVTALVQLSDPYRLQIALCPQRRLGPASHTQPLEDVMQVGLDRPFGDVEPATDLTIVEPGLHQDEDLAFTRGEHFGGSDPGAAGVEQDSGDGRVERRSAADHFPDAVEDVLGFGVFEQVAIGARA